MTVDYKDHILAELFKNIAGLLQDAAKELEPKDVPDLPKFVPMIVEATGFNRCKNCLNYPLVYDYGQQWLAMCPQCHISLIGKTKEGVMIAWNNLKADDHERRD